MPVEPGSNDRRWRMMVAVATIVAPLFAVLWLGVTLTSEGASLSLAVIKIVFALIAVGTGILGVRWPTASGAALLVQALAVVAWMLLRVENYPPYGALRTALLLAVPLGASGIALILADGMKAGTWPPRRFRELSGD